MKFAEDRATFKAVPVHWGDRRSGTVTWLDGCVKLRRGNIVLEERRRGLLNKPGLLMKS